MGASIVDFGPTAEDASTIFPYVAVGEAHVGEMDTDDTDGFDVLMRIHSYSNTGSGKQVKDMQAAIYGELHHQELSITGFTTILIYREDSQVMRTSKGAFHGVCEYRALIDTNP